MTIVTMKLFEKAWGATAVLVELHLAMIFWFIEQNVLALKLSIFFAVSAK